MSSQLTVIIAGIVLVVAIVVALVIMRRGDSRFTYDTQHGTAPRATEGEGNTAATAFKGRFSILTTGVGAMFAGARRQAVGHADGLVGLLREAG